MRPDRRAAPFRAGAARSRQGRAGRVSAEPRHKRDVSGWLILDKPYGMTSTQAVGRLRWLYAARKAGHAGTLDPLATGVLPVALGEATKTVPVLQEGRKVYRFTLAWGTATTTDDSEGEIVATSERRPLQAEVEAALPAFIGTIMQVPPAFSAVHVGGERAYDIARAGGAVTLAPRPVTIRSLLLLRHGPDASEFELECEKGTYVRALARDLAAALGTRGHVAALRRTAVGRFTEAEAVTLDAVAAAAERDRLLAPVAAALPRAYLSVAGRPALPSRIGAPWQT
ncbi:MAG TPA: tRNA pseudouridine(55) synthase TruB, partial [Alphaproteobacteria bacterium]|nr:tRNA pseudouridine(55) synthase TruB [Alphaproteobacteria bacterium]